MQEVPLRTIVAPTWYGLAREADSLQKEAFSRRDFLATVAALWSFFHIPDASRTERDLETWLASRGGSVETAQQVARSVGKESPLDISEEDLSALTDLPPMRPTEEEAAAASLDLPAQQAAEAPPKPAGTPQGTRSPETRTAPTPPSRKDRPAMSLNSYWKGRDREYKGEFSDDLPRNAQSLLDKVNPLLKELGFSSVSVLSGWRPRSYNEKLRDQGVGAAKNSLHISGEAVDILDPRGDIARAILKDRAILDRYGLWMEDPAHTVSKNRKVRWVHLDNGGAASGQPKKRSGRIFNP